MMTFLFQKILSSRTVISCIVVLVLPIQPALAEIYVSTSALGIQKWSTYAVDETYIKTSIQEDQKLYPTRSLIATLVVVPSNIRKTTEATRIELERTINQTSIKYGVDPELVVALISVESAFNSDAISPKGARGLMQLMPATAMRYGMKNIQELHVPSKNIDIGVRHLKDLLELHSGQVSLAIASYNAGQGAVAKHGQRIPQYRETMIYVPAVLSYIARNSVLDQEVRHD